MTDGIDAGDGPDGEGTRGPLSPDGEVARLTPEEEKVLRMSKGLVAPDSLELEWRGAGNADLQAKLREIEVRAFEQSGHLARLRKEAGVGDDGEAAAKPSSTKDKIISRLREKAGDANGATSALVETAEVSSQRSPGGKSRKK